MSIDISSNNFNSRVRTDSVSSFSCNNEQDNSVFNQDYYEELAEKMFETQLGQSEINEIDLQDSQKLFNGLGLGLDVNIFNELREDQQFFLRNYVNTDHNNTISVSELANLLMNADKRGRIEDSARNGFDGRISSLEIQSEMGKSDALWLIEQAQKSGLSESELRQVTESINQGSYSVPANGQQFDLPRNIMQRSLEGLDFAEQTQDLIDLYYRNQQVARENNLNEQVTNRLLFSNIATSREATAIDVGRNEYDPDSQTGVYVRSIRFNGSSREDDNSIQTTSFNTTRFYALENFNAGNIGDPEKTNEFEFNFNRYHSLSENSASVENSQFLNNLITRTRNVLSPEMVRNLRENMDFNNPDSLRENLGRLTQDIAKAYGMNGDISIEFDNSERKDLAVAAADVYGNKITFYRDGLPALQEQLQRTGLSQEQAHEYAVNFAIAVTAHELMHLVQKNWEENPPANLNANDSRLIQEMSVPITQGFLDVESSQALTGSAIDYSGRTGATLGANSQHERAAYYVFDNIMKSFECNY